MEHGHGDGHVREALIPRKAGRSLGKTAAERAEKVAGLRHR